MKKFNEGDVWLFDPDPENKHNISKDVLSELGALSKRPVCIIRGTDDDAPYDTLLVTPATSQLVPCIEFEKDEVSYTGKKRMEQLMLKPYEIYPVHEHQLVQYFGRLSDDELSRLMTAITNYIDGSAIANVCTASSMEAWQKHRRVITADRIRKAKSSNVIPIEQKKSESMKALEEEMLKSAEEINKVIEEDSQIQHFDVPSDFATMQKICKSYCGGTKPNQATLTMIRTVPLSDAEEIRNSPLRVVQQKYSISKSAVGAVKLLAEDYLSHNNRFSWKESEEKTVVKQEPEIDESIYAETIDSLKCYLTDKNIKYVPDNVLKKLLEVPEKILAKHYTGSAFKMHYSELEKRAKVN